MPRARQGRLTSAGEFRAVLKGGHSRAAGGLVVHVLERDGGGQPRLGLVVPRTVGTAVERNVIRRRIRELWREVLPALAPVDCVVVVRRPAAKLPYTTLGTHVRACLRHLGVLA